MSSRSIRMAGMPARFSFIAGRIRERVDSIWPAAFNHNLGAPGPGSGGSGSTRQTVLKPDRESTSRRKLGLIESDDERGLFSAVRFPAVRRGLRRRFAHSCARCGREANWADWMAERVGFEPTVEFPQHTLSKRAP